MIEKITHLEVTLAIIVSGKYSEDGVHFFTPDEYSQQLAFMKHPVGKIIQPHMHLEVKRHIFFTNEVLIIKKGRLRVDFYCENKVYLVSRILSAGDVILLVNGGHGFEVLEDLEMFEVKQGPYIENHDKVRFNSYPINPII